MNIKMQKKVQGTVPCTKNLTIKKLISWLSRGFFSIRARGRVEACLNQDAVYALKVVNEKKQFDAKDVYR